MPPWKIQLNLLSFDTFFTFSFEVYFASLNPFSNIKVSNLNKDLTRMKNRREVELVERVMKSECVIIMVMRT